MRGANRLISTVQWNTGVIAQTGNNQTGEEIPGTAALRMGDKLWGFEGKRL